MYHTPTSSYIGFLDVKDLVSWVVFLEEEKAAVAAAKKEKINPRTAPIVVDIHCVYSGASRMYGAKTEIDVEYLARRHRFHPVETTATMVDVATALCAPGLHRLPVVDNGKVVGIISQSNVVRLIAAHAAALAAALDATVSDTKLGSCPVQPVKTTDTALATFQEMSRHNRSGVAIVDETGRLVGNTSSSDLKLVLADISASSSLLQGTIFDFLAAVRQATSASYEKYPSITVSPSSTVEHLVLRMAATKVHRLFVVGEGYKPVAVVEITHLLRYLLDSPA